MHHPPGFKVRDFLSLIFFSLLGAAGSVAVVNAALETRVPSREGYGAVSDTTLILIIIGAALFALFCAYMAKVWLLLDIVRWKRTF